ncbi:unnamed protein product [Staurois parvus]|uniref:Uncharacterized protein n=1 Tax=Staurois parvus TaxID=386267 RepID=A0ABN9AE13_9NEOB|nr:unnamed protein product [Staurois parvus]
MLLEIHSSMLFLERERPMLFTHRSLPCQCYSAIAGCQRGISFRDSVSDICSCQ